MEKKATAIVATPDESELGPHWWRGYRGCLCPPDLGGEERRQAEFYPPSVRDRQNRVVRQVAMVLSHQHTSQLAAVNACRADLDVLIDACGANRVLIRRLGIRQNVVAGRKGPVTATLKFSIYLIDHPA